MPRNGETLMDQHDSKSKKQDSEMNALMGRFSKHLLLRKLEDMENDLKPLSVYLDCDWICER